MDDNLELQSDSREYELMLRLEQLESIEEELDEISVTSLEEVENLIKNAAISGSNVNAGSEDLQEQLLEIKDLMRELKVANKAEIKDQIENLNKQLDNLNEQ